MYKIPDILADIINDTPSKWIACNIVNFSDDSEIKSIVVALISCYATSIDIKVNLPTPKGVGFSTISVT